jgi:hypothetical protein
MSIFNFKEINKLNQINLENVEGIRFYYSKVNICLRLVILIIPLIIVFANLLFQNIENTFQSFFISFLLAFVLIISIEPVGNLFIKNPIFIINNDKLYYLKSDKWYDINNYYFKDISMGQNNHFKTYCMLNQKNDVIISEKNWYLKNEDYLKTQIQKNKIKNIKRQ